MQVIESSRQNKPRKKIKKSTIFFILYLLIFIILLAMVATEINDSQPYYLWAVICLILSIIFEFIHFKLLSSYANKYVTTTPAKSVLILSCIILLKFSAIIASAILLKHASYTMYSNIFWLLVGPFLYIIINRITLVYSNNKSSKKQQDGKRS